VAKDTSTEIELCNGNRASASEGMPQSLLR